MKKILNLLKRYREKADHGDAVLVTTLISIPLLCVCFAFATGISMATWQKTSYLSSAQAAATASLQTTQGNGYLGKNTMDVFVREYLSQTGRNEGLKLDNGTTAAGQGSASNENIMSNACSVAMINGVERQLPYIEVQLDINRSSGESNISTYPYWSEGVNGVLNNPDGGHGTVVASQQYRVINAKVWEASKNITWFGVTADTPKDMTCQPYSVDVSAILFGNNEDLSQGQQCFQPDMFPVDPGQVRQINTSPTNGYESPLTTCNRVTNNLFENDVVTVLGTYRTWSYVKIAKTGTNAWVPTSKLSDAKTWKITYNMNCTADGCGSTTKDRPASYNWAENPEPIVLESPTKTNYNFGGWQQYDNCDTLANKINAPADPMTIAFGSKGDLCFKAEFSIKTFWVTWDVNGGTSGGVAAREYPHNYSLEVPPNAVKGGYTSLGWFTHPTNATGKVTPGSTITVKSDLRYYQQYAKASNNISVAANGGTGGGSNPASYQINETASQTVTLTKPTRAGHTFQSWSVTSGPGSVNNSTDILTIPANSFGNIQVTANWSATSNNITVNANNGSGGTANPATYAYSANSRNVALTPPTRTGYAFTNWTISTNSSGVSSTVSGNTLTIPAGAYGGITVSANWNAVDYSITVNKNGGTGGSANTTYSISNSTQSVALGAPTRAGYQFTGWTKTGGPGTVSGNTLSIPAGSTGNIAVRADWAQIYSITVNKNGGTGGSANTTYYTQGSNQTKALTNPTRNGYSFNGWSVTGAGAWMSGSTINIPANGSGNITVTANWTGNSYQISVNSNGGSGGSSNPFEYNTGTSARNVALTAPTRTGHAVSSWTITTNTSGAASTISGNTLQIPANAYGNITVRANWTANTYTVTFNCNGRGSCPASTTYTYGVQKTIPNASGGGTFDGWNTSAGSRSGLAKGTNVISTTRTGNITLYAHWTWTSSSTQNYGASLSWNAYCSGNCYAYANWSWQCPSGGSFAGGGVRFYDTYANAWGSAWSGAQSGTMYVGLTNTSSRVGVDGQSWGTCTRTVTTTHTV